MTKQFALTPAPIVSSALALVLVLGPNFLIEGQSDEITSLLFIGALSIFPLALQLLWTFSAYKIAVTRLQKRPTVYVAVAFSSSFVIGVATVLFFMFAYPSDLNGSGDLQFLNSVFFVLLFLGAAVFFVATWNTAYSVAEAQRDDGARPPWYEAIGTFLLIMYLVVGVWVLRPRLVQMSREAKGSSGALGGKPALKA